MSINPHSSENAGNNRLPLYSVSLLSATALAYEVLLTRLFAIVQWHHYAFMIISLALLGYGASGTFLALAQQVLRTHYRASFIANLLLFGASTLVCFLVAQSIDFSPEEILYSARQWRNLAAIYLLLSLPFFFAANAIGLAFLEFRTRLPAIYAADLIGAGLGSLAIVALLFVLFPMRALQALSVLGLATAMVGAYECRVSSRATWVLLASLAVIPLAVPAHWIGLKMSPYKDLSQTLRITGSQVLARRSSPLGLIDIVGNDVVPLRHAPGLSLNAQTGPPAQLGLFVDGNGPSAITRTNEEGASLEYLGRLTSALPYYLNRPDDTLILGTGGGAMVLQALQLGAGHVDAVELNPQIVALVSDEYAQSGGWIYRDDRVRVITAEARGFVASSQRSYDLIQIPSLDSYGSSATGLQTLGEDYSYTLEAFEEYLSHLAPGGLLAVNRWVKIPPRDSLKVFATAVQALERLGVTGIGQRLALIRGWQTSTLLVKNGPFAPSELAGIRKFCADNSFDIAWLPAMSPMEANRFNILSKPYFYQGAKALLGDSRERFLADYKFNLNPSTDNQPFFFSFFRWGTLSEIAGRYGEGGVPLLDTGYLILVATLMQAGIASIVLILVPLVFLRGQAITGAKTMGTRRIFVYFAALGPGFLFIEIAFIQKLTLFLHDPLYAIAVALTAFLIFAGLGSAFVHRRMMVAATDPYRAGIMRPVAFLVVLSGVYMLVLPSVFDTFIQLPDIARILISIVVIAPLAFCMGMPFSMGLSELGRHAPTLIPWAWGINGCTSVVSTVLATMIAIHYGFNAVVVGATLFYVVAALNFPKTRTI